MLGGQFFGKKVDDNADFAKYDKVFCKNTFFKKSVFSLFRTMLLFLCEVCSSFLSLDVKSLEKKSWVWVIFLVSSKLLLKKNGKRTC